jgi:TetR/AcrR family transcriptional regulator
MLLETREKILQIARKEFAENGLAGARVDKIAENAGVNKAMIYYHFRSKENLYQAVIDEHLEQVSSFLQKTAVEAQNHEDLFLKMSEFLHSLFASREDFVPIMLREAAAGGERIKSALTRLISDKGIILKVRNLIDAGIEDGLFRQIDSKQALISFLGMNLFYLMLAPAINAVWEIDDVQEFKKKRPQEVVDLFLHGLKKK